MEKDIISIMDSNTELTQIIKDYINNECGSISKICLAAAGIADHVLALVDPDCCGTTDYHEYWVEQSDCSPYVYDAIDRAFDKANCSNK